MVKITAPRNHGLYHWNALVNYSIVVSYQGKSTEYQEIPAKDVLLTTTYVPDVSAIPDKPDPAASHTPAGLLAITRATCLGCHSFKGKTMGPSFAAVAQRYPDSQVAMNVLSQHIRNGCTGLWGQESMPAQPELTEDQLQEIVLWITKDAANPNVNYYVGTEGAFRMETATPMAKAGMMLTATYSGPAGAAHPEQAPHGEDTILLDGQVATQ